MNDQTKKNRRDFPKGKDGTHDYYTHVSNHYLWKRDQLDVEMSEEETLALRIAKQQNRLTNLEAKLANLDES